MKIKCNSCGRIFNKREDRVFSGKYLCTCQVPPRLTTDEFIQKASDLHRNVYTYNNAVYKRYRISLLVTCRKHGDFKITPEAHMMGTGCPKCHASKGELEIERILISRSIRFEQQKRFYDCRYKNPLPFDFYIPSLNICIEYNGEQHYKPVRFNGMHKRNAHTNYELQTIKDDIKKSYCTENGITLIVIPYWEFTSIESIIEPYLKTHIP